MDIGQGTGQQRIATGQQDEGDGGKSGEKEEHAENLIAQKDKSTEQQVSQSVLEISEAGGARGDYHRQIRRPAPETSDLQALPIIESRSYSLPNDLSTDQGLSGYKAKVTSKGDELEAANARFETLQYQFSSLRKEFEECCFEDSAGVFDEIRGRLDDVAAAIRSNPVGPEVLDRNSSVTVENRPETRPIKSLSFTKIAQWREYFSTKIYPVKAEKAKLSGFSKLAGYTSFLKIFSRGEFSSPSSTQSAGSNIETTSPTNPQKLPFEKSDIVHNQHALEDGRGVTITLRELARTTLRQHILILSKLSHRQHPVNIHSTSSRSHPSFISPFVPPAGAPTVKNLSLIFLYTANIVLFLTFLVAIAWALAAGLMADRERKMWLEGGETARMASVLLEPEGGLWEKGWGFNAGWWGLGGDVEGLKKGAYF